MKSAAAAIGATVLCASCIQYQPLPLTEGPPLPHHVPDITVTARDWLSTGLPPHRFDASDGLDGLELAMLAVVNNPQLRVARDEARVKRAQAFAAGLLPDPQLVATADRPTNSGPGLQTAHSLGLSEDITALLTYGTRRRAGQAAAHSADLNLLWQEWQVATQAQLLFVKLTEAHRLLAVLERTRRLFADRYRRTKTALERGLVTLDVVTPNLTALQDVARQIHDLQRQVNQARHDLNALLGLEPEAVVPLQAIAPLPPLDERAVLTALDELPQRRPDLVALRYGYRSQDLAYRAAILGQFPTFALDFTHAVDTSGVPTLGLGINLSLPFFNGNRGQIRVEQATRRRLYDDYQAQVRKSRSEVRRLLDEQRINRRQLDDVERGLTQLSDAAAKANAAFAAHAIDALAFATLQSSLLAKEVEKINLQQAMLEQRVALQHLLGSPLPTVTR